MTMIDEDMLRQALQAAAGTISVPTEGIDDIMVLASGGSDAGHVEAGDGASPSRRRHGRRRWVAAVAVAAALTVVGLLVSVSIGNRSPLPSSGPITASVAPNRATTTVPQRFAAATGSPPSLHEPSEKVPSGTQAVRGLNASGTPVTVPTTVPTTVPPVPTTGGAPTRIEETGSLSLTVGGHRLQPVIAQLSSMATALGGYPSDTETEQGSGSGSPPSGTVTLEVPEGSFTLFLSQAERLGRVQLVSTKATDATGQYGDLQSQITALEASQQQYLLIMTKAESIGDILSVQSQLDSIDSQLQQAQGQLQLLNSETTYSTLVVTVSVAARHTRPVPRPASPSGLSRSWHDAVQGFVNGVEWLIRIAGPLLFGILLLLGVYALGRLGWRTYRRRIL